MTPVSSGPPLKIRAQLSLDYFFLRQIPWIPRTELSWGDAGSRNGAGSHFGRWINAYFELCEDPGSLAGMNTADQICQSEGIALDLFSQCASLELEYTLNHGLEAGEMMWTRLCVKAEI